MQSISPASIKKTTTKTNFVLQEKVKELDYILSPGRYVGLAEEEDNFDFNEKFSALKKEFSEQLKEENKLNQRILESLKKIKYQK